MNKFKKATKRIAAVGVAAAYAATTALAGGLNVTENFVKDGKFFGNVVIGSTQDAAASLSIIAAMKSQFSGDEEKVEITYKSEAVNGDSLNAIDSKETLNIGETLESTARTFDDDESKIFEDGELKDDTYTQELVLKNGKFDYRVFDEIKGEDTLKQPGQNDLEIKLGKGGSNDKTFEEIFSIARNTDRRKNVKAYLDYYIIDSEGKQTPTSKIAFNMNYDKKCRGSSTKTEKENVNENNNGAGATPANPPIGDTKEERKGMGGN